jgi:hypothetical protein
MEPFPAPNSVIVMDGSSYVLFIDQLAVLFAVRSEKPPTELERQMLAKFQSEGGNDSHWNFLHTDCHFTYDERMLKLQDHTTTIALFNSALTNSSAWPCNDSAVKQSFPSDSPPQAMIKTNWSTERAN